MGAMIGILHQLVIDCPDPRALAEFYSRVLGLSINYGDEDWVSIGGGDLPQVAFQRAPDLQRAHWPQAAHPQQMHMDIEVEDVDAAEAAVIELGAVRLPGEGDDFRVFEDPSGHPFCLVFGVS